MTGKLKFGRAAGRLVALLAIPALFLAGQRQVLRAQGRTVPVGTAAELTAAVAAALPGDQILLAPGTYLLNHKLNLTRAGQVQAPIHLAAARLGEARLVFRDATGVVEGLHVQAPYWTLENLDIEGRCGQDDNCEHALHIVGRADGTVVRGSRLHGFNAQIKGNGQDFGDGWAWPDDVLIEGTEFFNPAPRQTGNPVTPIDVVGGRRWVVRGNFIHDHAKAGGDGISYAAFLKGNSRDGLFERNLVICEQLHRGQTRLGLSFGGGGSAPDRICEDGTCTPEHRGGVMRNNIIARCPADVGIYLNEAADSRVLYNTLIDGAGIDVRFAASSVELVGNVLTGRIRDRDGGKSQRRLNKENATAAQLAAWFVDPLSLDLRPRPGAEIVDAGAALEAVPDDYCGGARSDGRPDLGALEARADGGCDPRPAAWGAVVVPTPSASASPSPSPSSTGVSPTATANVEPTVGATIAPDRTERATAPRATSTGAAGRLWLPRLESRR